MKLSEWLKKYRKDNGYSLQDISEVSGLTRAYLNYLEKGINPSTGKPYKPSLETLEKLAIATHRTLKELAAEVEDVTLPMDLNSNMNDDEEKLLLGYRRLNYQNQQAFRNLLSTFLTAQSAPTMVGI